MEVAFLGRGGQGAFTSSRLLGIGAVVYEQQYALSFPTFGPERRGAPVFAYTKLSNQPIRDRSQPKMVDYFVILDESLYHPKWLNQLKEKGFIVLNTSEPSKYLDERILTYDGTALAKEYLGVGITNTAMLGVLVAKTKLISPGSLEAAISYEMKTEVADKNRALLQELWRREDVGRCVYHK